MKCKLLIDNYNCQAFNLACFDSSLVLSSSHISIINLINEQLFLFSERPCSSSKKDFPSTTNKEVQDKFDKTSDSGSSSSSDDCYHN